MSGRRRQYFAGEDAYDANGGTQQQQQQQQFQQPTGQPQPQQVFQPTMTPVVQQQQQSEPQPQPQQAQQHQYGLQQQQQQAQAQAQFQPQPAGGVPLTAPPAPVGAAVPAVRTGTRVYFDPETQSEQIEGGTEGGTLHPFQGAETAGGVAMQPVQQPVQFSQQEVTRLGSSVDPTQQCPDNYMRMSVNCLPANTQMWQKSGLPFGAVVHPMCASTGKENRIPLVNFGASGVVRCRRCRAYVNPFVMWLEGGRRWRCNFCLMINDCPNPYFSALDQNGIRQDVQDRPELRSGFCEIAASSEYMVRPPQPPAYVFVLDVGYYASASGALRRTAVTIKGMLDEWPGEVRAKIAFILFDRALTFVQFDADVSQPRLMTVPALEEYDGEEPFVPTLPDDILVNLDDSRELIDSFLDELPQMFEGTQVTTAALGPALKSSYGVIKGIGGKIIVCAHTLPPTLGVGKLPVREDSKLLGTDKEVSMLKHEMSTEGQWYKNFSLDCSRRQIAVDLFAFTHSTQGYADLATLGDICQFTGGQMSWYPAYADAIDGPRFVLDLRRNVRRLTGFEAVLRVRCSRGVKVAAHFGNFFIRSSDLLALPNVDADKSFAVTLQMTEGTLPAGRPVYIQAALLYTSTRGKRRIRVFTKALPVVSSLPDLFRAADYTGCTAVTARIAVERTLTSRLSEAREALVNQLAEMLTTYRRQAATGGPSTQIMLPATLQLYPLYILGLLKSLAFRASDVRPDDRVNAMSLIRILGPESLMIYLYPKLYPLHTLPVDGVQDAGEDESEAEAILPEEINLSSDRLDQAGAYLMDNGQQMFLWVGRSCDAGWIQEVFGVPSLDSVDTNALGLLFNTDDPSVPPPDLSGETPLLKLVRAVVAERRRLNRFAKPRVRILRQGEGTEIKFFERMVEDRTKNHQSYHEFLVSLQQRVQKAATTG